MSEKADMTIPVIIELPFICTHPPFRVLKFLVDVGDAVEPNQIIVEIEVDKAVIELPCEFRGVVSKLIAKPGDEVTHYSPLLVLVPSD